MFGKKSSGTAYILTGLLILLFFSVRQYRDIVFGECFFQTNILSCAAHLSSPGSAVGIISIITVVFVLYILGGLKLWRLYDNERGYQKYMLWVIGLIVCAILIVPFGSSDMVYYFNAGKTVLAGVNPFTEMWANNNFFIYPPAVGLGDQYFSYGPVMAYIFTIIYSLSSDSVIVFILLWKIMLLVCVLLCSKLLTILMRASGVEDVKQTSLLYIWVLQPLILFEVLGSGHFDVIWIAMILSAIWAAINRKWWIVFPMLALGVWAKFIPVFLIPWFVLWWWQGVTRSNWIGQTVRLGFGIAGACAITVLSWMRFWSGTEVFQTLKLLSKFATDSVFAVTYYSLRPIFDWLITSNPHWILTRCVHVIVLLIALYYFYPLIKDTLRVVMRKTQWEIKDYVKAIFVSLCIYLCIWQKAFWPWYVIWLWPFGLLILENSFVKKILIWISLAPLAFYPVWYTARLLLHVDGTTQLWFFWFTVVSIMLYPMWQLFQWRKIGYTLSIQINKEKK